MTVRATKICDRGLLRSLVAVIVNHEQKSDFSSAARTDNQTAFMVNVWFLSHNCANEIRGCKTDMACTNKLKNNEMIINCPHPTKPDYS
ncbi:hypothetical protein ACLOJK_007490 [Asimina triloba]